jgi:hypothetical protein
MSFETFNAENRNAGIMFPVRRCCSFCRNPGHNIQTCNDTRLHEFENLCITNYRLSANEQSFTDWLMQYSINRPNIVKAYAIRYCGCNTRHGTYSCSINITPRIRNIVISIDTHPSEQTPPMAQPASSPNITEEGPHEVYPMLSQFAINRGGTQELINLIQNSTRNSEDIALALLFINLIQQLGNNIEERKFRIQRKIVKCTLSEKCDCNICYENSEKEKFIKLNCGHEFCKECVKGYLKNVTTEEPQCAFCRAKIKNIELSSQEIYDEFNDLLSPST